jgi:predicted nucleic acid-binding protein
MIQPMKIYLDVCCLNRPFDDLSQDRICLEAEAVLTILSHCDRGDWHLAASHVIDVELSKLPDIDRFEKVKTLYAIAREFLSVTPQVEARAAFFRQNGIKVFDSLHLALADVHDVDVFLTTDDQLRRAAGKLSLNVIVQNPVSWLMETI